MRIRRVLHNDTKNTINKTFDIKLIQALLDKLKNKRGNLIPLLQGTQAIFGYIPKEAIYAISKGTGTALSDIYGVATFYSQFRLSPVGKHIIKVCHGTACHVQNAPLITEALEEVLGIKDGETTDDKLFTLESVACLGCCSLAPVLMIGDDTYGNLTGKKATKVIKEIRKSEKKNKL